MNEQQFGPFVWRRAHGQLWFRGAPLPLDARATAIFAALAGSDAAVPEHRLQQLAGGDTPIDGDALWEGVESLNRLLGACSGDACFVAHHPDDGFSLMVPPQPRTASATAGRPDDRPLVIGRGEAIARIARQLESHALVSIVGPGGMGKTTVARALAHQLAAQFPEGVFVADLSPLAEGRLVANAVGTAIGLAVAANDPLASLAAFARNKNMLLVMDSCEHVAAEAARVAEAVLRAGGGPRVLVTSREPLLAAGEWVFRLPAMEWPAQAGPLSAAAALGYSAIALFVDRVQARDADFELLEDEAETVANVCRRLDGIPLAIEIAAARATGLGLSTLARQLDDRLLLAGSPDRSVPARHQTLTAMLDWSHDQLASQEQCALRRLSIFRSGFTLDAAVAIVAGAGCPLEEAGGAVADLAEKSLLARTATGFRLLETTRAYASAKLQGAEREAAAAGHARYMLSVLRQAEADWQAMPPREWLARFAECIEDVRLALDWSFGASGDEQLGVDLAFAGFGLARQLSLDAEFRGPVERALAVLERRSPRDFLPEITLRAYIGSMGQRIDLERLPQHLLLEQVLEAHAPQIGARDQIIAIGSINHAALMAADFSKAARSAERAVRAASHSADPVATMIARRMRAQAQHFLGHHDDAKALALDVLANAWRRIPLAYIPSPVEQRVSMRILLARILWMQGRAESATRMADECMEHAMSDTAIAQCQALAMGALPIALWTRDAERSRELAAQLQQLARRHSLGYWQYWGERVGLVLALRETAGGVPDIRLFKAGEVEANLRDHLCTFDPRLLGQDVESRVDTGLVGWCAPEVLRLRAEALVDGSAQGAARAEALLREAIALARRQAAPAWELRAAVSLARLLAATKRSGEGRLQLLAACGQFEEGLATADLREARDLIAAL